LAKHWSFPGLPIPNMVNACLHSARAWFDHGHRRPKSTVFLLILSALFNPPLTRFHFWSLIHSFMDVLQSTTAFPASRLERYDPNLSCLESASPVSTRSPKVRPDPFSYQSFQTSPYAAGQPSFAMGKSTFSSVGRLGRILCHSKAFLIRARNVSAVPFPGFFHVSVAPTPFRFMRADLHLNFPQVGVEFPRSSVFLNIARCEGKCRGAVSQSLPITPFPSPINSRSRWPSSGGPLRRRQLLYISFILSVVRKITWLGFKKSLPSLLCQRYFPLPLALRL